MYTSDKEAEILEYIYHNNSLKQRELANKAGISLGMVNTILKQLIKKGWLIAKRLNSRNIKYVITTLGEQLMRERNRLNIEKTLHECEKIVYVLEKGVDDAIKKGYHKLSISEKNYLYHILEYICYKKGLQLVDKEDKDAYLIKDFE